MSNVVYFNSTMSGSPTLTNTAGSFIGILDACLVDGLGSVTLDSLVVALDVATATVSGGHQFAMIGACGPVIRISGANPSGLNGDWRVTVTSATQFTFATTGISDQTATGTIAAKRAPAGYSKAFSGTNKAAYRSDDITGTRLYLRVDDSNATYAIVRGYEVMTDVDTGTGLFPTAAQAAVGAYAAKPSSAGNRPWTLIGNGKLFYFIGDVANNSSWNSTLTFGDGNSYVAADAYGAQIIAAATSGASGYLGVLSAGASWLARAKTQTGTAITTQRYTHAKCASGLGYQGEEYTAGDPVNLWPVEYWDANTKARGLMPGLWCPVHNNGPAHGTLVEDIPGLPGRTLLIHVVSQSSYRAAFDLTGPW